MSQQAPATYIQTGKVTTSLGADYVGGTSTPASAKAVRYTSGPPACNTDSKQETAGRSSILKNRFMPTPSVMSMFASDVDAPKIPIARPPTYQLGPAKDRHFKSTRIEEIVKAALEERLINEQYSLEKCKELTTSLPEHIIAQLKRVPMDRYKLVCTVLIGQRLGQGLQTASRCAWDDSKDSYASVTYENTSLCAVATVYGIYAE